MAPIPSGTITLVFTDIEGSTARWEQHPEKMNSLLRRHDELLHQVFAANGGHVFKTVGDAFYVAFSSASSAARAALNVQRALADEEWGGDPPRVRISLHTGDVRERDGDYFGPPLNRVARLLGIAHAGQVILSGATARLLDGGLPADAILTDLGEHRLRDLLQSEQVWQLHDASVAGVFPPLRSLGARPHNLPVQRSSFVGRAGELAQLGTKLRAGDARLLTLTGPGGAGKTRLALQAAAESLGHFDAGAWFVSLADTSDSSRVLAEIAQTLGVGENPQEPLIRSVLRRIGSQRLLLVIDNFEQVVDAAPLIGELLAGAAELRVLVTSRERLHLYGEHNHPVQPLALPDLTRPVSPEALSENDSVNLFVQRAQAVRPDFLLEASNAHAVAGICVQLDGLPLALELAAARLSMFSPSQLLQRLNERLKTVASSVRDLPERQRTLRGAIDWSYSLLPAAEQRFFARVSVFDGGFDVDAAEAVCGHGLDTSVEDALQSLIDKSLLRVQEGSDGSLRFGLMPTLHEYAAERLRSGGERDALRSAHAEHFHSIATRVDSDAWWGSDTSALMREELNCLLAVEWWISQGNLKAAAEIVEVISWAWRQATRAATLQQWSRRMLAAPGELPPALRGRLLGWIAEADRLLGNLDASRQAASESLAIAHALGDHALALRALMPVVGSTFGVPHLFDQGETWLDDWQSAAASLGSALDMARAHGMRAEFYRSHGRLDAALGQNDTALALARKQGYEAIEAIVLTNLARTHVALGNRREALAAARASVDLCVRLGEADGISIPDALALIAAAFEGHAEAEVAARLVGAYEAALDRNGSVIEPQDLVCHENCLSRIRAVLPAARVDALMADGRELTLTQARILADTIRGP